MLNRLTRSNPHGCVVGIFDLMLSIIDIKNEYVCNSEHDSYCKGYTAGNNTSCASKQPALRSLIIGCCAKDGELRFFENIFI